METEEASCSFYSAPAAGDEQARGLMLRLSNPGRDKIGFMEITFPRMQKAELRLQTVVARLAATSDDKHSAVPSVSTLPSCVPPYSARVSQR